MVLPGRNVGLVVGDHGLELVERLVDLGLLRFERGHLVVECAHLLAAGGGKRCDPLVEQRFLRRFVLCGLVKGGDIAREALAEEV